MARIWSLLMLVVMLAAPLGCGMCSNRLDCCGPVYEGGTHPPCEQNVRAGSILSPPGGAAPIVTEEPAPPIAAEPQPAE